MATLSFCAQPSDSSNQRIDASPSQQTEDVSSRRAISLEEGVARLAPSIDEIGKAVLSLSPESDDATVRAVLMEASKKMREFAAWVPDISQGEESIPQQASLAQRTQSVISAIRGIQERVLGLSRALEKNRPETPVLQMMKGIDVSLTQFCAFFDHICPIDPEKLPKQEDVELLGAVLARSRTVSSDEAQRIELLLSSAIGNRDLNRHLGRKDREARVGETPKDLSFAELCLRELTYTTMQAPSASKQIQKLEEVLHEVHADEFSESLVSYRRQERELRNQISAVLKEKDESWAQKGRDVFAQLERMQDLLEPMQNSSSNTQQLQQRRVEILGELQEILRQLETLHGMPKRWKARTRGIVRALGTATDDLQRLLDTMDEHEERLRSGQWVPPLALRDFWVLRRYKEIAPLLEKLHSRGFVPKDERLKRLAEESVRARASLERCDAYFHALPNNMTGDVVVIDDRREKELEGKVPVETFEDAKQLFDMAMEKTHDLNAAIWPLRALAEQGLTHVAYAFMNRSVPTAFEIIAECEKNPIDAEMAMISSSFRLTLSKLLTEEGREALSAHFGDGTDEQLEKRLQAIYRECQGQYFDENKSRFATFDNRDPLHAVQAFLSRSMADMSSDTVLGRLYRYALDKFSSQMTPEQQAHPEQSVQKGLEELEAEDSRQGNKRLCSELVAEVVRDVQRVMEQRLQHELGIRAMVFRPVIPADRKIGSYTIDVLVEELKRSGAYSRVPDSLAVRLCVRLPEPVAILRT
jgi:hypothetical protein